MQTPPTAFLPSLDPLAAAISRYGWMLAQGAIAHRVAVGSGISLIIAWLIVALRRRAGDAPPHLRTSAPSSGGFVWIGAALLAGTWGQVLLFSDYVVAGAVLYAVGVALAIRFGALNPLRQTPPPLSWASDAPVACGLLGVALAARLYAIDQLPAIVDFEPARAFFESLTPYGLRHYIALNRVADDGFFQMLARYGVQQFTGPSLVGIRLAAAFCGTAAVPLCYWLARRLTGVFPAALAALVLATAPEQLIFSRTETTQFSLIPIASLITVHLTLSVITRWRVRDAVAATLWMPISRYFYAPAIILFLLPLAGVLHGVSFGPRRLRAARLLPILLAGVALWLCASPALQWAATGKWSGGSSLRVYGVDVFRPYEIDARDGEPESKLDFFVTRFEQQGLLVLRQLGYNAPGYSAWYQREHPDEHHLRMICAALLVPLAAAIGYLIGRWRDARAALLLVWIGLGLLPGILSDEPDPRRLTVFFAAVPVVLGVFVDAMWRFASQRAPRLGGWTLAGALGAAAACIAVTSLAADLRIYRARMMFSEYLDCTRPFFESSDLIVHNIDDDNTLTILAFGNAEPLLRRLPALQRGTWTGEGWADSTCAVVCPFSSDFFTSFLPPEAIRARCFSYSPRRVTYLLRVVEEADFALAARIMQRFPDAVATSCIGHDRDDPIQQLVAITVDR